MENWEQQLKDLEERDVEKLAKDWQTQGYYTHIEYDPLQLHIATSEFVSRYYRNGGTWKYEGNA